MTPLSVAAPKSGKVEARTRHRRRVVNGWDVRMGLEQSVRKRSSGKRLPRSSTARKLDIRGWAARRLRGGRRHAIGPITKRARGNWGQKPTPAAGPLTVQPGAAMLTLKVANWGFPPQRANASDPALATGYGRLVKHIGVHAIPQRIRPRLGRLASKRRIVGNWILPRRVGGMRTSWRR